MEDTKMEQKAVSRPMGRQGADGKASGYYWGLRLAVCTKYLQQSVVMSQDNEKVGIRLLFDQNFTIQFT